jgi:hypothetical protein
MEPYILTRVTMSNCLTESRERARNGMRKNASGNLLLSSFKNFRSRSLRGSANPGEKISRKILVCYW